MEEVRDVEFSCISELIDDIKNTLCFLGKAFPKGVIPRPKDARVEYLKIQSKIGLAKCLIEDEFVKIKPSLSRDWIDLMVAFETVKCFQALVESEIDDINIKIRCK